MNFSPRTEAPLGTSSRAFFWGGMVLLSPLQYSHKKKVIFQIRNFIIMATWATEAHSKVPPTDFFFRIGSDFVENGPLLYLPSGH